MLRSVGKFAKDRKGAFALQFALMAIPMTVCTGLAIDGGRAYLARYELGAALDAAALALGSVSDPKADLNVIAHKFVNANYQGKHSDPIVLEVTDVGDKEETLILKGKVTINTYFMPLVGQPKVTVAAESEVKRGGNNVEVTLALDVTESMGDDAIATSRISTLRSAAADLVDTVVSDLQTPFYSRISVVPWSNNIYVGSDADKIRGPVISATNITGGDWKNGAALTAVTANWRTGSEFTIYSIAKISSPNNRVRITVTGSAAALVNGDTVGVYLPTSGSANGGFGSSYRNRAYKLAGRTVITTPISGVTFDLQDPVTGNYVAPPGGSTSPGTSWRVQECLEAFCHMRLTNTGSNNLSANDWIHLTGFSAPYTGLNNANGTPWQVLGTPVAPTSTNVFINVVGPTIGSPNSTTSDATNGTMQKCFNSTCAIQITSPDHGLSNGQYTQISGVSGLATLSGSVNINQSGNTSWQVEDINSPTDNTFLLTGSIGPNYGAYSLGGVSQCLVEGCAKLRFTNSSGGTSIRPISECVSERVGANQYTDAPPSTTFVGRDYAGTGDYVRCETKNKVLPLTSNKTALKNFIKNDTTNRMQLTGATAGQMGAAWGWYMLSPDWGYLWPNAENKPGEYTKSDLKKVLVLMTDGEFNTAHCNGVVSGNYGVSNNSDRGNCNATNGSPFTQAQNLCTAMKAKTQPVIIYTVGFEITAGGNADNFLKACATDLDHYRLASNSAELKKAFDEIAASISMLRIAR